MKCDIVVVDDDPKYIKSIKFLIEEDFPEYNVRYFTSSIETLDYFLKEENSCRVLLVDLNMPEVKGDELLDRIPLNYCEKRILMTDFWENEEEQGKTSKRVLNKPFAFDELVKLLKE